MSARAWWVRFATLFDGERGRATKDRELAAELEAHLQMHIEDNVREGMAPEAARRGALMQLGGLDQTKEKVRERRGLPLVESLFQDVRFGLRMLRKSPGFTVVAVLTLALGIGANATVFTLVNAALLKGLPFDKQDRIVYLGSKDTTRNFPSGPSSYPDFRDWRAQAKSFTGLAAGAEMPAVLSDGTELPETYRGARMTANCFQLVGQKPVVGRDFTAADEAPGAPPVVMLTYGLWERRYGADISVIGRVVRVNGTPTTVIGVMPLGFDFPANLDLWEPMTPSADWEKREVRELQVIGRLADGATLRTAQTEMAAINKNLRREYPLTNQRFVSVVISYNQQIMGPQLTILFTTMLVAVVFVLLMVCANIANLLLARAVARSREISIRMALGAERRRVIRQLLVESVLLAAAGGLVGWLLAIWGVRAFDIVAIGVGKPHWIDFSMDYRVFGYVVTVVLGAAVLFGLAPALRLSKVDVNAAIKDGGRGAGVGMHRSRLAALLVTAEVALGILLMAGAGLMIRSFLNGSHDTFGVNRENVLTMRVNLPATSYRKSADWITFYDRLEPRLAALPGVQSVAIANVLPSGFPLSFSYELEGQQTDAQHRPVLRAMVISPDYFRAVGVELIAGRTFAETDRGDAPVAIVNREMAAKLWPGQDVIGKRLRIFSANGPEPWATVVGVVPNIRQDVFAQETDPLLYLPYRQNPLAAMSVLARTTVPPGTLSTAFRQAVQAMDADLPVNGLRTLEDRLSVNYWMQRVFGTLFAIFAGIALLLASLGLYALMAHSVSQRTHEIGVRMAMGATPGSVLRLTMIRGTRRLAIGLVLGLVAAFGLTHALESVLVGVSPGDPVTFAGAAIILALAALVGCFLPARRGAKVDPMVALRYE